MPLRLAVPARLAAHPLARHAWSFAHRLYARSLALRLPQAAGSLAYLSLFAFVPVTAIALAALTALPRFSQRREAEPTFLAATLCPPTFSDTVVRYVNQFAAQAGGLSALGLLVFLATAVTTLFTIEKTLNAIWQVEPRRTLTQRVGLYWTLLTLAPPLLGASIALESYFWTVSLSVAHELRFAQRLSALLLPWVLTVLLLAMLYRLLPGGRVRWRHALSGALMAATIIQAWRAVLGHYASQFASYTVVYGAFAALPALLSWLYALWLTVLAGALIASEARFWARPWRGQAPASPARRFEQARRALDALVDAQARDGARTVSAAELAALFDHHPEDAQAVADLLERAGYVRRLLPATVSTETAEVWDECWVLVRDASRLTLRALRDAIWRGEPAAGPGAADLAALVSARKPGTAAAAGADTSPDAVPAPPESELDVPLQRAAPSGTPRQPAYQ